MKYVIPNETSEVPEKKLQLDLHRDADGVATLRARDIKQPDGTWFIIAEFLSNGLVRVDKHGWGRNRLGLSFLIK
jgi:hypothetical protein